MYRYKLVNNNEFEIAYKKYIRKNLLKGSLILIGIINLLMLILSYFYLTIAFKTKLIFLIFFFSIIVLTELLVFIIAYKKEIKKILNTPTNNEVSISFDDEGIYLEYDNVLKHVKWKVVHSVVVDKNNLMFLYKATGLVGNFFYLKFFDVEGEEVIKDIEKYIKVRRS